MNVLPVRFKLEEGAVMPKYANPGDAGLDLVAWEVEVNNEYNYVQYNTGVSVEIPVGYVGLLFPNSRVSKKALYLSNSVGVIDSSYRGNILLRYRLSNDFPFSAHGRLFPVGDVVGQLIILPYPTIAPIQADELTETERGNNGFGSTAK